MNNNKVETIGAIIIIAIVVATIIVVCSIYVPAESEAFPEGAISFPSYWEYDTALVKNLQRALNTYDEDIKVDGKFGPKTSRAIKNVQARYNLDVTGVVDDDLARRIAVEDWPYGQGLTMYYMADHEAIYDLSDYEESLSAVAQELSTSASSVMASSLQKPT
ncbi:peptidoglycan-binding protein [Candidatus Saccharibacteria bacterium]|nr:peptidoglycan-binding protein [Candidatus Saccharibacteria bacterium]